MACLKKYGRKLKADRYQVNGIDVTCVHCQYDKFELGKAQLNTVPMEFSKYFVG